MTDRPIIFSAPMIRALLDGRKTMTRRLAWRPVTQGYAKGAAVKPSSWQRVRPGDRLWVREAHYVESAGYWDGRGRRINYRATAPDAPNTWTPSIHMPRWASRLTLTVTAKKIERLRHITVLDARAEGFAPPCDGGTEWHSFLDYWNELHGPGATDANPEVVVLTFTVEKRNIDALRPAA